MENFAKTTLSEELEPHPMSHEAERQPYGSTGEYLQDYYARLTLQLQSEVNLARALRGDKDDSFLGLFLSDDEIDGILQTLNGATVEIDDETMVLAQALHGFNDYINARLAATSHPLLIHHLADLFDLSSSATELLLLLLAPEIDSRFGRIYAYLQDDVSRRWLSPELALRLLGFLPADPAGRTLFARQSPLLRHQLIQLETVRPDVTENLAVPLIERALKLDDRIANYLLGQEGMDDQLVDWVALQPPYAEFAERAMMPAIRRQVEHLTALWRSGHCERILFWGPAGSGKAAAASMLAQALERPLLSIDAMKLSSLSLDARSSILARADREARLRGGLLYIHHADDLEPEHCATLMGQVSQGTIVSAQQKVGTHALAQPPIVIHFDVPDYATREQVWAEMLIDHSNSQLPADLATRFQLTPGQIKRAAQMAQHHAWLRDGEHAQPNRDDLFEGCRQQSNPALARLARKVQSPYSWADLVLPVAQKRLLHAIEKQVEYAPTVFQDWGFAAKLQGGTGLNALFAGPSGTGKTMAAGIIAATLGLDMYQIDLSGVVSKYIGETEKNLDRIFREAGTANAILFFDEADALFGKRSEVKDAHDRYANIEVSYLLQKMEEYAGVAILATNFSQNLDNAFTRRMHFVIEFPLPGVTNREQIWRKLIPADAPCSPDIDFTFLATQFELSGGNIRNCVLAAAFLAAEAQCDIGMDQLAQGVVREYGKLGRSITRASFGEYYRVVRRYAG